MIAWEALPDQRCAVKARAARDRLRRLAALTALRWPGFFASMRSWLAVRDCARAAEEVRGRSAAACLGVDIGRSVDRPSLPQ